MWRIDYANTVIEAPLATSTFSPPCPHSYPGACIEPTNVRVADIRALCSATQIGVDRTLSLIDVAHRLGFATADHDKVGLFTFTELASGARSVPIQKRARLRHEAATRPQAVLASATATGRSIRSPAT